MKVLVTGAAGRIGQVVTPALADAGHQVVAADVRAPDLGGSADVHGGGRGGDGMRGVALDITDLDGCRAAFTDVDVVVHLAADPSPSADFMASLLPTNVVGVWNVVTAAADAGCRRLVLASSVQAVDAAPPDEQVPEHARPRPASPYGVTKAFAEALGSYAADHLDLQVVAVRIGFYDEDQPGPDASRRARMTWLSPRDCAQLMVRAVDAPVDGFLVVNGVSDNACKRLGLTATRRALGYAPVDDGFA